MPYLCAVPCLLVAICRHFHTPVTSAVRKNRPAHSVHNFSASPRRAAGDVMVFLSCHPVPITQPGDAHQNALVRHTAHGTPSGVSKGGRFAGAGERKAEELPPVCASKNDRAAACGTASLIKMCDRIQSRGDRKAETCMDSANCKA